MNSVSVIEDGIYPEQENQKVPVKPKVPRSKKF